MKTKIRSLREATGLKHLAHGMHIVLAVLALIGCFNTSGQTVTVFSSDAKLVDPGPIATDGKFFFVANGTSVLRVPVGGGTVTSIETNATPCCISGMTAHGTNVFFIDPNG